VVTATDRRAKAGVPGEGVPLPLAAEQAQADERHSAGRMSRSRRQEFLFTVDGQQAGFSPLRLTPDIPAPVFLSPRKCEHVR